MKPKNLDKLVESDLKLSDEVPNEYSADPEPDEQIVMQVIKDSNNDEDPDLLQ